MVKIPYLSGIAWWVTPALLDLQILHEQFDAQIPINDVDFKDEFRWTISNTLYTSRFTMYANKLRTADRTTFWCMKNYTEKFKIELIWMNLIKDSLQNSYIYLSNATKSSTQFLIFNSIN